ncbi:MAG: tRNA (cytidine(34)-2'-O)-methyltransferase [Mycoplasmoidaceae bacterium]|nr:tRNA (cytidine(34)-2'-O)-methyltransferase [Mycoplasmoidaceae bacterium]
MKLHIVLFEPEIPQNTGNIARTCVGFNAILHLIRPYGFVLSDKNLKRSGCDYWKHLKMYEHDCYEDFIKTLKKDDQIYYITRYGKHHLSDIKKPSKNGDIYLMFGRESTGINKEILVANKSHTIRIPSSKNVRSLNLSNCVAICAYEIAKLSNFSLLEKLEPHKIDYLDK